MPPTTKKPRAPSRQESDAAVDAMLAESPWSGEQQDSDAISLGKELRYELKCLEAAVAANPRLKTPEIAARLDFLRKEYREWCESFGLTPAGRRSLGVPPGTVSSQKRPGGLTYRRPGNPGAVLERLVEDGTWDAIGTQIKARLRERANNTSNLSKEK